MEWQKVGSSREILKFLSRPVLTWSPELGLKLGFFEIGKGWCLDGTERRIYPTEWAPVFPPPGANT